MNKIKMFLLGGLVILSVICGVGIFPSLALADVKEYPASTALNFISYSGENSFNSASNNVTTQTGDWIWIALSIILLLLIMAGICFWVKKRGTKIILLSLVAPLLIVAGGAAFTNAYGLNNNQNFVNPTIDVYVHDNGGPVHYGEGDRSNVQTYNNVTEDIIYIDEIILEAQNPNVNIGEWQGKLDDGTIIFNGGVNSPYILDVPIVLFPGENFKVTWGTSTDSKDLKSIVGTAPVNIKYKTYDAQRIVNFETNGGSYVAPQKVIYGDTVIEPTTTREHNKFIYWASDEALNIEYDFSSPVNNDLTLYAKWEVTEEYLQEVRENIAADFDKNVDIINNFNELTEAEKAGYIAELSDLKDNINNRLDNIKTEEELNEAIAEYEQKVLEVFQEAGTAEVSKIVSNGKDTINSTPGITDDDKTYFNNMIDELLQNANNAINNAKSVDEIKNIIDDLRNNINQVISEATELGETKIEAKNNVADAVNDLLAFIDSLEYFSDNAKTTLKDSVTGLLNNIINEIDNSKSVTEINSLVTEFLNGISELKTDLSELNTTKGNLFDTIDNDLSDYANTIYNLLNLSIAEQNGYVDRLDIIVNKYKGAIKDVLDDNELNELYTQFKTEANAVVTEAQILNTTRDDAAGLINDAVTEAVSAINSLSLLSETDKEAYKNLINEIANQALTDISNTQDLEAINNIVAQALLDIKEQVDSAEELNNYKQEALNNMEAQINAAKTYINTVSGLTAADKERFIGELDTTLTNFTNNLITKSTKVDVDELVTEYTSIISTIKTNADTLGSAKNNAHSSIEASKEAAIALINTLNLLSNAQKAEYIAEINALAENAKTNVNNAGSIEEINTILSTFESNLTNIKDRATELQDTKQNTVNQIETFINNAKQSINSLTGINDNEKTGYKNLIDRIDFMTDIINSDGTDTSLNNILNNTKASVTAIVTDATNLSVTRIDARSEINAQHDSLAALINSLSYTTDSEKAEAQALLDEYTTEALNKVNNYTDTGDIDTEVANYKIDTLELIKELMKQDLTNLTNLVKEQISTKINEWDAATINATIDAQCLTGKQTIDGASSIDDVITKHTGAITDINDLYNKVTIIELTTEDDDVIFQDNEGHTITNKAVIKNDMTQTADVKIVINNENKFITTVQDNKGSTYIPDGNNIITITFDQAKEVTARSMEAYACIYTSAGGTVNDTLEFRADNNREDYELTFDCINITGGTTPGWWGSYIGAWGEYYSTVTTVNFTNYFYSAHPKHCAGWFGAEQGASKIKTINNLSNLNLSSSTSIQGMFKNCDLLTTIDVASWDTSSLIDISDAFSGCSKLTNLDVSNWNTKKVNSIGGIFNNCSSLTTLDISSWNIDSVIIFSSNEIFKNCTSLKTILHDQNWAEKFNISGYEMFKGCVNLPHFDDTYIDKTYAYPDTGISGYFSPKTPLMVLNVFEGGHYADEDGNTIINVTGDYANNARVKIVVTDDTKVVDTVTDNVGNDYIVDANNFITIPLKFNGSINVTLKDKAEPYAVIRDSGDTNGTNDLLEFRNDAYRETFPAEMTFDVLNTGAAYPAWSGYVGGNYGGSNTVTTVTIYEEFKNVEPTSCYGWFYSINNSRSNITSINGLENLNTSSVTTLY